MGWIAKRFQQTGRAKWGKTISAEKRKAPLRKITTVLRHRDSMFDSDFVELECGHQSRLTAISGLAVSNVSRPSHDPPSPRSPAPRLDGRGVVPRSRGALRGGGIALRERTSPFGCLYSPNGRRLFPQKGFPLCYNGLSVGEAD